MSEEKFHLFSCRYGYKKCECPEAKPILDGYVDNNIKSDKEKYIKEMNKILLQDVDNLSSDNFESIDRVTPAYYYIEIKGWKRFFLFGFYKWKCHNLKWWYLRKRGKVETVQMDAKDQWLDVQ